nr:MAG TPA: hypothetical protein [Caudoviricetes sp.]
MTAFESVLAPASCGIIKDPKGDSGHPRAPTGTPTGAHTCVNSLSEGSQI